MIWLIFVVVVFFNIFVFRYLRRKINNLEILPRKINNLEILRRKINNLEIVNKFTRQRKFIMLPDVAHSRTYKDAVVRF